MTAKFCPFCNSRAFESFRDRKDAKCSTCGSLERHRAFGFALLALSFPRGSSLCFLQRNSTKPGYSKYLSDFYKVDVLQEAIFAKPRRKFDLVYHDHLLHGSDSFAEHTDYSSLILSTRKLIKPSGIQLFSVGFRDASIGIREYSSKDSHEIRAFAPKDFGESPVENVVLSFDPTTVFGADLPKQGGIGHFKPNTVNGNSTLILR